MEGQLILIVREAVFVQVVAVTIMEVVGVEAEFEPSPAIIHI